MRLLVCRAGMKPENVLSDEGIRERFKYSRIQPHDGADPHQPLQSAPPIPHLGHFNYNTHPYPGTTLPLPLPYPGPMMPHPHHFPAQSPPVPGPDKLSPASPAPSYIRVSVIKRAPQPLKVRAGSEGRRSFHNHGTEKVTRYLLTLSHLRHY